MSPDQGTRGRLSTIPPALVRRFVAHEGFVLAGALSFSILLCLAPLTLLLFSAAGFILKSEQITEYALDSAIRLFPGYGDKVVRILGLLTQERRVTGILGAVGLMAFASQLFALIRTVTNTAFQVPRRRGLVHGFIVDVLFVVVLGLLVVILSAAMLAVLTLGELGREFLPWLPVSGGAGLAAACLMYVVMITVLFFVYRTAPNRTVPVSAALPATIIVALLWESARWGLTLYLARFGTYGKLYGSLGVVVATLVWIYYSAVIFVLGAELAALLSDGRSAFGDQRSEAWSPAEQSASAHLRMPRYALAGVAGAFAATFALQNSGPVTIRFLFWSVDRLPVAGVVLVPLVSVAVAYGITGLLAKRRLQADIRVLRERIRALEALPDHRGTLGENPAEDGSGTS